MSIVIGKSLMCSREATAKSWLTQFKYDPAETVAARNFDQKQNSCLYARVEK
jgi:hypothetical protein